MSNLVTFDLQMVTVTMFNLDFGPSTVTAPIKVQNDFDLETDPGNISVLVLLNLTVGLTQTIQYCWTNWKTGLTL